MDTWQDYVKSALPAHKVAWTRYPLWQGYFPCKNDIVSAAKLSASGVPPHSASSSEMAVYHLHARSLRTIGADIGEASERSFRGVRVEVGPAIVLAPSFAPCFTLLQAKLPSPSQIKVSARSTLVVSGADVIIEQLDLDGALVLEVAPGGKLRVISLTVHNAGWDFAEMDDAAQSAAEEASAIRGYTLTKREQRVIKVLKGEEIVVENGKAKRASLMAVHLDKSMRRKKKPKAEAQPDSVVIKIEPKSESAGCCVLQ